MYEVNANGGRSYTSDSASSVARVAAEWKRQGHEPSAYAKTGGAGPVSIRKVAITTARETAKALVAAAK